MGTLKIAPPLQYNTLQKNSKQNSDERKIYIRVAVKIIMSHVCKGGAKIIHMSHIHKLGKLYELCMQG